MTISPFTRLAAAAAAGAQATANFQLTLIGNQLTANLNKRIAQLKAQSNDPSIPLLQQQAATLSTQKKNFDAAHSVFNANASTLADLTIQLSNLAVDAQAGNGTSFDQTLAAANTDVSILQIAAPLPGLLPDGVAPLKTNGLGIKSSASYNFSTPAGITQAQTDVQAAESLIQQISSLTSQNEAISSSVSQTLGGQITGIDNLIANKQDSELTAAAGQIATLKQQTQTQFHLIELGFGKIAQTSGILTSVQNNGNNAPPPGSIISLLDTQAGTLPTLAVANLTTPASAPTTPTSTISTTA